MQVFACVYLCDFQVGNVCSLSSHALCVYVHVQLCVKICLINATNITKFCFFFVCFWFYCLLFLDCRYTQIVRFSVVLNIEMQCFL